MPSIKGTTVLIFGGTSGVGYGVADKSLAEGAIVHISSSNLSKVTEAVSSLKKKHPDGQVTGHTCDLRDNDVEQRLENLFEEVGPLDHIVFTAGDTLLVKPLQDIDLHSIQIAGHIRFVVPLLIAKLALRFLRPGSTSSLTLTTGAIGERPFPNWALVAGYAAGLHGVVKSLAIDMKPLRANLVSLGPVKTPLTGDQIDAAAGRTLLGKVGTPDEVAEAYVYLMKDSNATGSCVSTNAGLVLT